jgi:folate-binding protein YgfZ
MPINISTYPAVFPWRPAAWLRVSGDDAADFLQGQFTNDLRGLAGGRGTAACSVAYGLWLSVKGKAIADSFVLRGSGANEFWIGSYFSLAAVIRARLESHIIADDVVVEDQTSAWAGLSVFGELENILSERVTNAAGFVFNGRRGRSQGWELVFPVAEAPVGAHIAGATLDDESMERFRIGAGIPAIPRDVGPADLPNEAGLEADAISYSKGCYLGQEVMARLKSMGQVRRRLLRVRGKGEVWPALPAAVFVGTRQVGELRSAVGDGAGGWIGLAMLSLLHLTPDAALTFTSGAAGDLILWDTP